jgi:D-alanyl-D-alanine dipeptidase
MKIFLALLSLPVLAAAGDYALDDAHNHDGTHVDGQENCGGNYMFPGDIARLGSHSFLIFGEDGPEHLILDHRSGTPPHTYQFLLRVKVDAKAMATYRRLLKESKKSLPAVTTIYFDKTGKQVDRTFFCLHDLPKIFGAEAKRGDAFDKLFPIRATWQKNADFEGAFPIQETITPDDPLVIARRDVELLVYRYLPSYMEQTSFRAYVKEHPEFISHLSDAPQTHDENVATAAGHRSYITGGGFDSNGETCPANVYLRNMRPPKTRHAFVILAEKDEHTILATHLYDQAPQNFQTAIEFELSPTEMKAVHAALTKGPLLFWPRNYFCMADIRAELKRSLRLSGDLFSDSNLNEFEPGHKIATLTPLKTTVLVNRTLQSLMNPQAVARDVFGVVDVTTVNPKIRVEGRYASAWNFLGRPVKGYRAPRCYLTGKAAAALNAVEKDVEKLGYNLLAFDCYRPQRAVDDFVAWVKGGADSPTKPFFYPSEERAALIKRGYIDDHSGHSRGSTIDLTLVRANSRLKSFHESYPDCRKPANGDGQLDMGTAFDCFSEMAFTAAEVAPEAKANRKILLDAMAKHGFKNYPKEWWHFSLSDEPYKTSFDFEVQ